MAEKSKTRRLGAALIASFLPFLIAGCMVSKSTYQAETVRASDFEAQNKDLRARLRDQAQSQRQLEEKLAGSETARAELEKKVKIAGAGTADANTGLENCWKERESLSSRLDVESRSLKASEEKLSQLKNRLKELEDKAKATGAEGDARNAKLSSTVEQLRARVVDLETERDILTEQKNRLSIEKNEKLDEMTRNSESMIDGLKKERDDKLEASRKESEEKLAATSKTYEELLKKTETEYQGKIDELSKTYEALIEGIRKVERERLAKLTAASEGLAADLKTEISKGSVIVTQQKDHVSIKLQDEVLFASGKAEIKSEGKDILQKLGRSLKNSQESRVVVEGHTDNVPIGGNLADRYQTNWDLSAARAVSVVRYFAEKSKISEKRLTAAGYGEFRPVASNDAKEGRMKNRRIEIKLLFEE